MLHVGVCDNLSSDSVTCSLCPRPGIVSAPGSPNRPSRRLSDIRMQNCEAQGKGRAKGRPRKVTQWSFIDGGWWMVDGGYPFPDALH